MRMLWGSTATSAARKQVALHTRDLDRLTDCLNAGDTSASRLEALPPARNNPTASDPEWRAEQSRVSATLQQAAYRRAGPPYVTAARGYSC